MPAPEGGAPRARRRRLAPVLAGLGTLLLAGLLLRGGDYYLKDGIARFDDPRHRLLRPSGGWGHGIGIVASCFIAANFLYPLRKRARRMHRWGPVPRWLTWHVFVGLMGPVVILFHASFRFNNLIASFTYGSLVVVVTTGLIGRTIYSLVPGSGGRRAGELADLQSMWESHAAHVTGETGGGERPPWLRQLLAPVVPSRQASPLRTLGAVVAGIGRGGRARRAARELSRGLPSEAARALVADVDAMTRLRFQIEFFAGLKRLLAGWRLGHSILAVFLLIVILVHVAVSLAFGYRWIFG